MKGTICIAVFGLMVACEIPALAQGATKTIYDNRGKIIQRWENMGFRSKWTKNNDLKLGGVSMLTKEVQLRFCKGYIQIVTGLTVGFDMIVADWREYNQSRRYSGLRGLQSLLFTTTC